MANASQDKETGKFLAEYSDDDYKLALDAYVMYGGRQAAEISGIPVGSIKQKARALGIQIADKKKMEKHRATIVENRRIYLRSKMLDTLEKLAERITGPYTDYKRAGNFGFDKIVYPEPPARELDKLVNAFVSLNAAFRTELGESNTPIVKVEAPQEVHNTVNINTRGIADTEARNRALEAAAAKLISMQQKVPEPEIIEAEVIDDE